MRRRSFLTSLAAAACGVFLRIVPELAPAGPAITEWGYRGIDGSLIGRELVMYWYDEYGNVSETTATIGSYDGVSFGTLPAGAWTNPPSDNDTFLGL